ncbi:MAG: IPT/TIG domain-containing protein [Actinomycetota bacterium]|nr:IPT/TIG domain-containing protein [Actinomycetota bacterium]
MHPRRPRDPRLRGQRSGLATKLLAILAIVASTVVVNAGVAHAAVPTVSRLTPASGTVEGGQVVSITGTGFVDVTAVTFGTVPATEFTVVNDKLIYAVAPPQNPDPLAVEVSVTNADGPSSNPSASAQFTYVQPTITAMSARHAVIDGTPPAIAITGKGFTGVTAPEVTFNGVRARAAYVISDTSMYAVPDIRSGKATPSVGNVRVSARYSRTASVSSTDAGVKDDFYYINPPKIDEILNEDGDPVGDTGDDGGAVGDTLTIIGTDLYEASNIYFGSKKVAPVSGSVETDGTGFEVVIPTQTVGLYRLFVDTAFGQTAPTAGPPFGFLPTSAPTISTASPGLLDTVTGGMFVVTGTGFTGVTVADVLVGGEVVEGVVVVADTQLIVEVGPGEDGEVSLAVGNAKAGFTTPTVWSGSLVYEDS